jgi:predicted Zn-dependent protease
VNKRIPRLAGACALALVATTACTTTEFSNAVGSTVMIATGDAERADRARSAAGAAVDTQRQLTFEEERELGAAIALQVVADIGKPHPSRELQRYVNLVGLGVARQSSRPGLPYSFAVLENETPNAVAAPGGYVFITTGALALMENEAELAGVLAHEIAHITERHILKTFQRSRYADALAQGASAARGKGRDYAEVSRAGKDTLLERGLNQEFEYESDVVGTEIATLAGYDPRGLRSFLDKMGGSNRDGGWLKTHPNTRQRLSQLDAFIAGDLGGATGIVNRERFQQVVSGTR